MQLNRAKGFLIYSFFQIRPITLKKVKNKYGGALTESSKIMHIFSELENIFCAC